MKILLIIIIINSNICLSQDKLYVGKKKYFNKTRVTSVNFDKINTVYKRIYFKIDTNNYKTIGIYGNKIKPYLKLSENKINLKFDLFKKNKLYSQICFLASFSFFTTWIYRGIAYNLKTGNDSISQFGIKNKQYLYFLPSLFCFSGSIYFNIKSAKNIKQCVKLNNKFL